MSGRRAAIKRLLLIIPMILYTYAIAILFYHKQHRREACR